MNKQVLSIDQMNHLKELGLDTSNASMEWITKYYGSFDEDVEKVPVSVDLDTDYYKSFGYTFTLQDILELLPKEIEVKDHGLIYHLEVIYPNDNLWEISYTRNYSVYEYFLNDSLIGAAYDMLCWCIENGFVK